MSATLMSNSTSSLFDSMIFPEIYKSLVAFKSGTTLIAPNLSNFSICSLSLYANLIDSAFFNSVQTSSLLDLGIFGSNTAIATSSLGLESSAKS